MISANDPELLLFKQLLHENRYDFCKLVYLLFPFGQKGHPLEFEKPYTWQMKEWKKLSDWLSNPATRYQTYKLVISTGNGSGKTAFGAMTMLMLLYTQMLRGRLTANTKPQLTQVLWPAYDKWFRYARFNEVFFEKFGESIKSLDAEKHDQWQFSLFTWDESNPAAVSGLHNKGNAVLYTFEEAPGIPAEIFKYANGAFAVVDTIKIWLVFGNSDDPDSKFEALMSDPGWNALRIDTRTLDVVDKNFIETVLRECNGDEDADDFRVRVRGLPRKTNADSIINRERVRQAMARTEGFDLSSVNRFPSIITVDPAWTGGDYNSIWWHQGHYHKLLAYYKLDKGRGDDHKLTYDMLVRFEKLYRADRVLIDQGEGTAIKTLANNDGRFHWELVSFAAQPTDAVNARDSLYANMRAQMYWQAAKYFNEEQPVIDVTDNKDLIQLEESTNNAPWEERIRDLIVEHMGFTKGDRHKISLKKLCESKKDIKARTGRSPDLADSFILKFSTSILDRLPENTPIEFGGGYGGHYDTAGSRAMELPESVPDYSLKGFHELYHSQNRR